VDVKKKAACGSEYIANRAPVRFIAPDNGPCRLPRDEVSPYPLEMLPCRSVPLCSCALRRVAGVWLTAAIGWTGYGVASAEPRATTLGVTIVDRVDMTVVPAHLRTQHPVLVRHLGLAVRRALGQVGRFRIQRLPGAAADDVDFEVRIDLNQVQKVYTNELLYYTERELLDEVDLGPQGGGSQYEVVSLPSVNVEFDVRLVAPRDVVLWSASLDSTVVVPHDESIFIYNTWKYPGATDPGLTRQFLADILRLQDANRWVERVLSVSDRWIISRPGDDLRTAQDIIGRLAASFAVDVDDHVPLEGRVLDQQTSAEGEVLVKLDVGGYHGLALRHRLELWRPPPAQKKVGQVEIVRLDSTTAVARIRKLDRDLKKTGESLQQYRVISPKRASRR